MKKLKLIMIGCLLALVILAASCGKNTQSGNLDSFAKCLADSGARFYGAFWCPHCTSQKTMFGSSFENIDYIECSLTDKSQNQACKDAGINAYPTWEFMDGSRIEGELTMLQLAQKTGCKLGD